MYDAMVYEHRPVVETVLVTVIAEPKQTACAKLQYVAGVTGFRVCVDRIPLG